MLRQLKAANAPITRRADAGGVAVNAWTCFRISGGGGRFSVAGYENERSVVGRQAFQRGREMRMNGQEATVELMEA